MADCLFTQSLNILWDCWMNCQLGIHAKHIYICSVMRSFLSGYLTLQHKFGIGLQIICFSCILIYLRCELCFVSIKWTVFTSIRCISHVSCCFRTRILQCFQSYKNVPLCAHDCSKLCAWCEPARYSKHCYFLCRFCRTTCHCTNPSCQSCMPFANGWHVCQMTRLSAPSWLPWLTCATSCMWCRSDVARCIVMRRMRRLSSVKNRPS